MINLQDHVVTVKSFRSNNQTITAKAPFDVEPIREGGLYVYKKDDIALDCYLEPNNLHRAPQFVALEMSFLWRNYALEADDKLDPEAQCVKKNLLDQFAPE